jgi:hypothetical protein
MMLKQGSYIAMVRFTGRQGRLCEFKVGNTKDPFSGDAINAYNDGPVEDGTQMGPFYELESSSPAANLKPGEKLLHRQRIFHFEGSEQQLSVITEKIFGISLNEVKEKFE